MQRDRPCWVGSRQELRLGTKLRLETTDENSTLMPAVALYPADLYTGLNYSARPGPARFTHYRPPYTLTGFPLLFSVHWVPGWPLRNELIAYETGQPSLIRPAVKSGAQPQLRLVGVHFQTVAAHPGFNLFNTRYTRLKWSITVSANSAGSMILVYYRRVSDRQGRNSQCCTFYHASMTTTTI